jgi:hypothetical protein
LVDDSREKCSENNFFNCVHPLPFLNPLAMNDRNDTELRIYGSRNSEDIAGDVVPNGEEASAENPDTELEPSGRLWNYLTSISSCFRDGEAALELDSNIRNEKKEQSGAKNSEVDYAGDSLNRDGIRKEIKSASTISLAALVKAKGQYICRTA